MNCPVSSVRPPANLLIAHNLWVGLAIVFLCTFATPFPQHAATLQDGTDSKEGLCGFPDPILSRICEIVGRRFDSPPGSYVSIGGDYYLVPVTAAATILQGLYVANLSTGQFNQFGGYGFPEIIGVDSEAEGSLWISAVQRGMFHGLGSETERLLERRYNPITKTPYLLPHITRVQSFLSEEMAEFCSSPVNQRAHPCTDVGIMYPSEDEIKSKNTPWAIGRGQMQRIIVAHQKALAAHKSGHFQGKLPFQILEEAGIWRLIDIQPKGMPLSRYVQVLNDYAFFAYQYGEGRNHLAIELLNRLLMLNPQRTVTYLNLAEALEHLAKFGASEYADIPLDKKTIEQARTTAMKYREKYLSLSSQNRKPANLEIDPKK